MKPAQLIAVVGHQADEVGALAESLGASRTAEAAARRAGHAMQIARRAIGFRAHRRPSSSCPATAPLLRAETLAALAGTHRRGQAASTVLSAELDDPSGYGRIVRDSEGRVQAIVEDQAATLRSKPFAK